MLGSRSEADDAVQDTWLRAAQTEIQDVENLPAWLTTVVARVCLDMLRKRKTRQDGPLGAAAEAVPSDEDAEHVKLVADSVGAAMLDA